MVYIANVCWVETVSLIFSYFAIHLLILLIHFCDYSVYAVFTMHYHSNFLEQWIYYWSIVITSIMWLFSRNPWGPLCGPTNSDKSLKRRIMASLHFVFCFCPVSILACHVIHSSHHGESSNKQRQWPAIWICPLWDFHLCWRWSLCFS